MLIREKIAIALAIVFIGAFTYDSAFTESPTVVEEPDTMTGRRAHQMPQDPPQAPETAKPTRTLPDPVVRVREPLTPNEATERIEELEGEVQDAMQQAEDGE